MTDKVHPVVEAVANAIFNTWAEREGSEMLWTEAVESAERPDLFPNMARIVPLLRAEAKAAAKVLLSMEPTEGMLASATVPGCEIDPGLDTGDVRWVYERMTSRAREEMGV